LRWPLRSIAAAGLLAILLLAVSFNSYWPATHWTVLPKAEIIQKGRQAAGSLGVDVTNWQSTSVVILSKPLTYFYVEHPREAQNEHISPLSLRITYHPAKGGESAEVGVNSAGEVTYWKPPHWFKGKVSFDSDDLAAKSGLDFIAGKAASSYKSSGRRMGDEAHEEIYIWKRTPSANSDLRQTITIETKDAVVESLEAKTSLFSVDEDSDTGDKAEYWDVLTGIFQLICVIGTLVFMAIYILWLARKVISHNFPIRVAAVFWMILMAAGLMRSHGTAKDVNFAGAFFSALLLYCLVAVARCISQHGRPKWISLEQILQLAPLARTTGQDVAAGLAAGPLLAAIPFLIAACGLFPHSWVLPRNAELLYAPAAWADYVDSSTLLLLLGFFGFGLATVQRSIRVRWLRWLIILPMASVFFANEPRVVSGPLAAPLTAGLLIFAVLLYLWHFFDLLAILVAQFSSTVLLDVFLLHQKGMEVGGLAVLLICAGLVAAYCLWRGQETAEGDPRASVPTIGGFRAEREKLKAEFSVAARAQQDMLPRTPPLIPGCTMAASCTPSLDVGGDLYDFLKLQDGRLGFGVADVSGKGVPAALYMTLTKGLLAAVTRDTSHLPSVMEEVNRHLYGVTRKKVFVTMVLGFLDPERRLLQCARAGHNPVVWRRKLRASTELVSSGGLGLGITASRVFGKQLQVAELQLSQGDAVVFYSDGITEAMNASLEQFGEERLMSAVERTDDMDAAATHDSILGEVREFLGGVHPQDDMTLVVLRVGDLHL
jgi:hypothetical protein